MVLAKPPKREVSSLTIDLSLLRFELHPIILFAFSLLAVRCFDTCLDALVDLINSLCLRLRVFLLGLLHIVGRSIVLLVFLNRLASLGDGVLGALGLGAKLDDWDSAVIEVSR
jgi:hypothetical protein